MSDRFREELVQKLKSLTETLWRDAVDWPTILQWLDNFEPDSDGDKNERLHALFLLSQFMYFGKREMRELLKALFRDLYRYPIVEGIRRSLGDATDCATINARVLEELAATRFLGVGNPSESGTHLLYYFRQENQLDRSLFINSHELFTRHTGVGSPMLGLKSVRRYVFIDDFCGSGTQAVEYSTKLVQDIKSLDPHAHVSYYALFATAKGLKVARDNTMFDHLEAVLELDESFECFHASSRYFRAEHPLISKDFAHTFMMQHGVQIYPSWPLGYKNGQLLIGFFHNVPDNTLPVVWQHPDHGAQWVPVFRRYPKIDASAGI